VNQMSEHNRGSCGGRINQQTGECRCSD